MEPKGKKIGNLMKTEKLEGEKNQQSCSLKKMYL